MEYLFTNLQDHHLGIDPIFILFSLIRYLNYLYWFLAHLTLFEFVPASFIAIVSHAVASIWIIRKEIHYSSLYLNYHIKIYNINITHHLINTLNFISIHLKIFIILCVDFLWVFWLLLLFFNICVKSFFSLSNYLIFVFTCCSTPVVKLFFFFAVLFYFFAVFYSSNLNVFLLY